ncbi:MAG: bifunctional DNA-formamidopyrimidine glycosylase/DNA-(apurinic or apyrimidinic site) lyase [Alphaproteobacteria bacterium]|nr:bifunctional DNA-formamidopyrimidine glycosylase/DNA-(apurinic or apyrimidinic site) lyase [Alphaproteobacteria bacterium]
MPELPEVETVRRGLAPVLVGRRLRRAAARRPDLRFPLPPRFAERLTGARVERLERRAKYLLAALDTGESLIAHLGMSGRFLIHPAQSKARAPGEFHYAHAPDPGHTHIVLETDRGDRIEFNDPRRFGYMDLVPHAALAAHPYFRDLGPEPLEGGFNGAHLAARFAGKKTSVKAALLDQRVVAGLGNIYVCEALFRTRIDPRRAAGRIARPRLDRLAEEVRAVLFAAIEAGGSSLKDFAQASGELGYFQHRFQVYDREGAPCLACKRPVSRLVQSGRSTFFCRACQR